MLDDYEIYSWHCGQQPIAMSVAVRWLCNLEALERCSRHPPGCHVAVHMIINVTVVKWLAKIAIVSHLVRCATSWQCANCENEAVVYCCWTASYCSAVCQKEHWEREHASQCRHKQQPVSTAVPAQDCYWLMQSLFSEAKASDGASNKLIESVIEYAIFLHRLAQQWGR